MLELQAADLVLVAARLPGSHDARGVCLFAVEADADGVTRTPLPTLDQTRRLGRLDLAGVDVAAAARVGAEGEAWAGLEQCLRVGAIMLAAEQLGGAQACLDMSVAYTLERHQFGRPIAGFQAIKHRAAEMMLAVERARSAVYYAACVAAEALDPEGDSAVAAELPWLPRWPSPRPQRPISTVPLKRSSCMAASALPGSTTPTSISSVPGPARAISAHPPGIASRWPVSCWERHHEDRFQP